MELNSGMQPKLLTDKNTQPNDVQLQYITDDKINNNSVKEIYFRWLSRLVVLCAILSLGLFLSASLVIFRLAPEIIVEPLLIISQNDSATMVRYEPITPKMPSIKQMTELFIKQYVIMRNTVVNDTQEMRTRWGPGGIVAYLSSPRVYYEFVGQNIENVNQIYNLSRSRSGKNGALTLKKTKMRASITPRFIPERRAVFSRLINPLGFTVMKYNQDEIRE